MKEIFEAEGRPAKVIKDRYEILRRIGKGSYGTVYACRDYYLANSVIAMKVFPPHVLKDRLAAKRLAHEIQAAHRVDHENVVRFYDFFKYSDFCAITMEFVDGPSLHRFMEEFAPMPYGMIVDIARQICIGLQAIHAHGIIHRDLKPDNILIAHDSIAKITDFGIAALGETDLTPAQQYDTNSNLDGNGGKKLGVHIVGTGRYISPESVEFNYYDKRSDVYAFGVILYEMITGNYFFTYKNFGDLMRLKIEQDAAPPEEHRPDCPELLSRICIKALQRNPDNRYQDISEVLEDLRLLRKAEPDLQNLQEPAAAEYSSPGPARAAFASWLALAKTVLSGSPKTIAAAAMVTIVVLGIVLLLTKQSTSGGDPAYFEDQPESAYRITVSVGRGAEKTQP